MFSGGSQIEALRKESRVNPNVAKVYETNIKPYIMNSSNWNKEIEDNFVTTNDKTNIGILATSESLLPAFGN